jgi:hypothetical protein
MSEDRDEKAQDGAASGDAVQEKRFFEGEVDEELLGLPAPPKPRSRNPWFMGIVILLSVLVLWWFRFEVIYFFRSGEPVRLGDAMDLDPARLPSNAYVTVNAWPNPTRAVKFQRRLRKATYRVVPAVGQKKLFIQTLKPEEEEGRKVTETTELEGVFTGRLISFGDLESTFLTRSGYKSVRIFFREKLFVEITDDCFLLMEGATPRSYWGYLLLALVVITVGTANSALLVRHLRRRFGKR